MCHLQGIIFAIYVSFHETLFQARYHREIFALADGEKIAMDWFEEPQPTDEKQIAEEKRPLLVCIGGLGGGHHAPYMKSLMKQAKQDGY